MHAFDSGLMHEHERRFRCAPPPHAHRVIFRSSGDKRAVLIEGRIVNRLAMAVENDRIASTVNRPDSRCPVAGSGENAALMGTEGDFVVMRPVCPRPGLPAAAEYPRVSGPPAFLPPALLRPVTLPGRERRWMGQTRGSATCTIAFALALRACCRANQAPPKWPRQRSRIKRGQSPFAIVACLRRRRNCSRSHTAERDPCCSVDHSSRSPASRTISSS